MKFALLRLHTAVARSITTPLIHVDASPKKRVLFSPLHCLFLPCLSSFPAKYFWMGAYKRLLNGLRQNCCIFAHVDEAFG